MSVVRHDLVYGSRDLGWMWRNPYDGLEIL
jgi:hypothetical protein